MSSNVTPMCHKCGTTSKLVSFNTFEYFYCPTCKDEVNESGSSVKKAVWINKGATGVCDNCGVDLIEAVADIEDAPTLGSMINLIDNFKRVQTGTNLYGFYDCNSCNGWMWHNNSHGCSKFDNTLNRLLINVRGKGWI